MDKYSLNNSSLNVTLHVIFLGSVLDDHFLPLRDQNEGIALGLVILYAPTFLAAMIGNSLLAIVILARRRFRNVCNFLLCNLAISDLSSDTLFILNIISNLVKSKCN